MTTDEKETPSSLCDSISLKLHRVEISLHDVVMKDIPSLLKMMDECEKKAWVKANRKMLAALGKMYIAHAMMGDCRDKTFPDVEPQGGGT